MQKIKHLTPRRKIIPLHMDAAFFFERAVQSLDRYRYDKALKYFSRAVEYEPENAVNHCNMAGILSEMGKYDESNRVLKNVVEQVDPSMTECYFYMANNYANMEDFESAEKALLQYLENDPEGQFIDESEEMMEMLSFELERPMKITKVKSREGLYEHDRARAMLEEGRFTEAIKLLERLVRDHPDFTAAHNNLALAYYYVGRFEDSFASVRKVLEMDPGNLHGLCNLAIFYQNAGDKPKLDEMVQLLAKTYPYHQEHVFKLATTMGVLGHHDVAYRHFRRLLKGDAAGIDPTLYHYAAVACYNTGKYAEAERLWKQAEKLDPGSDIPKFYLSVVASVLSGEAGSASVTVNYHYHLPFEEQLRQLQRAQGAIPERLRNDPLLRSSFYWALRHGDRDTKLQVIQAYGSIADSEVEAALRELLLNADEDDYVKKVAVFVLRSMGAKDTLQAVIDGEEVKFDAGSYTPDLPAWNDGWQEVLDLTLGRMSKRYDMIQQHDMVTLWVEFLSRLYPSVPRIGKKEGWAGALEYLTAKMHRRPISYQEVAQRYGASIATISKNAKLIDDVCGLRKKMKSIFASFQEKL
ncbi:tetratricopeptide repeat protein [Paenibacillus thermotolerans]|uniref:tetratricopeptide repeat protein n=1 Tax=Paenibacillus thermotolerans TaxID=3027807 RepID=UPI003CC614C4